MTTTSREYELFTQIVYQALVREVPDTRVEHDVQLSDPSGVEHQVDVYLEFKIAGHVYRTIIECKQWTRMVDVGPVTDFYGLIQSLGVEKGIMVSKLGFSDPAREFAHARGIDLVQLRKPSEEDLERRIKRMVVRVSFYIPEIADVALEPATAAVSSRDLAVNTGEARIVDAGSGREETLQSVLQRTLPKGWPEDWQTVTIPLGAGTVLAVGGERIPVSELRFRARFHRADEQVLLDGEAIVRAILRDVFTGEIRTVRRVGA